MPWGLESQDELFFCKFEPESVK